jgi:hypothetical protein
MNSWHDSFSYYINLRTARISSMDTIISSFNIPNNISNKNKDTKIIINIGLMESLFKLLWAQKWQRQKDFQDTFKKKKKTYGQNKPKYNS